MYWPGSVWLQNMVGMKKNDTEMKDIPAPLIELHVHVMEKTIQAGSLLGGWIIPLLVHPFKKAPALTQKIARWGRMGMIIGVPMGPIMTTMMLKSKKADEASIYDRSYRLRYNITQLNVDRASLVGAVIGFGLTRNFFGLVCGLNSGIVGAAVYNNAIRPKLK